MDRAEIEALYSAAHNLYEMGDYAKASGLFTQLLFNDPFQTRFWKGLAAAQQMGKEYRGALRAWATLALLKNDDPTPHFHAAECYLFSGDIEEAKKALACAASNLEKSHPLAASIHHLQQELSL